MRYFEDFKVGEVIEGGARTVTRDEIVAFAREFDPQPFHTDEAAARQSIYGGLIASGWHTAALMILNSAVENSRRLIDGGNRG
jgi:acyl dehydratase